MKNGLIIYQKLENKGKKLKRKIKENVYEYLYFSI